MEAISNLSATMHNMQSTDEPSFSLDEQEYWEAFQLFDKDGDGTISTGELKNLLRCFDVDLPDEQVEQLISKYDEHSLGSIEFDSLKEIMKSINETQEMDQEIQEVYKLFAKEEQGVSAESLLTVMNQLLKLKQEFYQDSENQGSDYVTPDGEQHPDIPKEKPEVSEISRQEAEWLVEFYDIDQDGKLNLEEFAAIFMEKSQKFKKHYRLFDVLKPN